MRLFLFAIFICVNTCYSQTDAPKKCKIKISPFLGIMNSNVQYSISGNVNGQNPNILSELIWKDLKSASYGIRASIVKKRFNIESSYHLSHPYKGKASDLDYSEDNRTGIFSEQYFASNKGFQKSLSFSVGYNLKKSGNIEIIPSLNYLQISQRNYLLNGDEGVKINNQYVYVDGLNSYYSSRWNAVGLGITVRWCLLKKFEFKNALIYHYGIYDGYGRWNLRQEFRQPISYTHKGRGNIFSAALGLSYGLNKRIGINLQVPAILSKAKNGIDELYYANGNSVKTKLNEVVIKSIALNFGCSYAF
ncbi:MAG: hypothetical protein ACTHMM_11310 [Agriterribacter sp.]